MERSDGKRNGKSEMGKYCTLDAGRCCIFHFHFFIIHMPKVTFHYADQTRTVEGENGKTILQIALDHSVPMEHACGGNGFCTTCRCKVKNGAENLSPRNEREENMGMTEEPDRLGCQAEVHGDVEVEISED